MAAFSTYDDVGNMATLGVGSAIPANMGFLAPNTYWVQPLGITEQPLSGTATAVQDAQTATASGAETLSGAAAAVQAAQTIAATAAEIFSGTAQAVQSAQTASAAGSETISGTGTGAQSAQTASAAGSETISGAAAPAQSAQTAAALGAEVMAGTAAAVQAAQSVDAAGTSIGIVISGTAAPVQDAQTAAAAGIQIPATTGTASAVQDAQTVAATGATFIPVVGESFVAGDRGVAIVVEFGGLSASGGTVTLYALPAIPPGRQRAAYGTAQPIGPVVVAANGLTGTYTTTGFDFPSGGNWLFQARVFKPSEQAFMSGPRQFYIYPHL